MQDETNATTNEAATTGGRAPGGDAPPRVNLAHEPTAEGLAGLLAACDDTAAHHVLWVDAAGFVHINALPDDLETSDGAYVESLGPAVRFRWEAFCRGNDYVGPAAAASEAYVANTLRLLRAQWDSDQRGYLD
ncbi:MAG TPA: hypothetical protein VFS43_40790 [Polyangiaceae bacterium]|nr:hypothetical protein [Polyangiaceae bacterium]